MKRSDFFNYYHVYVIIFIENTYCTEVEQLKRNLIFILFFCTMLSGCQKTPSTEVVFKDETSSAEDYFEEVVTEEGTLEPIENMTVVNLNITEINETFQIGDKTITFSGTLSIPDKTDGLYLYNVTETSYDDYFNNMDFLFGDNERQVDIEDENHKYAFSYIDVGNNIRCSEIYNQRGYVDGPNMEQVRDCGYSGNWDPRVKDEDVVNNMTFDEAKKQADEIINRIGVKSFKFEKCFYWHYEVFEGNYPFMDEVQVIYRQYLQGVPVKTYYGEVEGCGTFVSFVSKGLGWIRIAEYEFERILRYDKCLTYEEAYKCFEEYVDSCDYYHDAIFTDISFQYVLMSKWVEGEKQVRAVPFYKFDALLEPALNNYYPDIYVDATNGRIYSKDYIE